MSDQSFQNQISNVESFPELSGWQDLPFFDSSEMDYDTYDPKNLLIPLSRFHRVAKCSSNSIGFSLESDVAIDKEYMKNGGCILVTDHFFNFTTDLFGTHSMEKANSRMVYLLIIKESFVMMAFSLVPKDFDHLVVPCKKSNKNETDEQTYHKILKEWFDQIPNELMTTSMVSDDMARRFFVLNDFYGLTDNWSRPDIQTDWVKVGLETILYSNRISRSVKEHLLYARRDSPFCYKLKLTFVYTCKTVRDRLVGRPEDKQPIYLDFDREEHATDDEVKLWEELAIWSINEAIHPDKNIPELLDDWDYEPHEIYSDDYYLNEWADYSDGDEDDMVWPEGF